MSLQVLFFCKDINSKSISFFQCKNSLFSKAFNMDRGSGMCAYVTKVLGCVFCLKGLLIFLPFIVSISLVGACIFLCHLTCRNPSLGFATKARACKGASQEWNPGVTFHALESVSSVRKMNPHTPKWTPTLGVDASMDTWTFKRKLQGSKLIGLKSFLYHWKVLAT
jgi:hypothetical protein